MTGASVVVVVVKRKMLRISFNRFVQHFKPKVGRVDQEQSTRNDGNDKWDLLGGLHSRPQNEGIT